MIIKLDIYICLAIYISSRKKLPTINWNKSAPYFFAKELGQHDAVVKKQFLFSNIHVRYLGASEGCGCGFIIEGHYDHELQVVMAERDNLLNYVKSALEQDPNVQLFGCWEGDQRLEPTKIVRLSLSELRDFEFEMNERVLVEKLSF